MLSQRIEAGTEVYIPSLEAERLWLSCLAGDQIRGEISKERFLVLLAETEPEERCIGEVSQP